MHSLAEATNPPIAGTLSAVLTSPVVKQDEILSDLMLRAEALQGATFIISDYLHQRTAHFAAGMVPLSGYSTKEAREGGPAFVLRITKPADIASLMLLQSGYIQEAKAEGFDPCSIRFHDYNWTLISKSGSAVPIFSTGVVLTYSPQNDFDLGVGFLIRNDANCDSKAAECKDMLRRMKQRHNEIHRHETVSLIPGLYPIHHVSLLADSITERERQVLGMLAQGHSTDVIAGALHIAVNTVESHRKKLLQKFSAKNVAELIKKASKVFWLA